jgi:hypothetical protein
MKWARAALLGALGPAGTCSNNPKRRVRPCGARLEQAQQAAAGRPDNCRRTARCSAGGGPRPAVRARRALLGGLPVRAFADLYPGLTAGLVLVDAGRQP